ncbi:DUF4386 domain-containing protein [Aquimarina sp. MMG015]|uniref:DUF4386 domain-containing protein n=1 Tax=Aquimarina sp. MMG015 TaxID=2822689 RepID=UPI001B39CE4E|nr:DUF4386 domain-containing protein [Aquimarina sp. MMG015]MBQ4802170.1 DUF4386 domain-containing protein [Aquimarina sp. MMG015]
MIDTQTQKKIQKQVKIVGFTYLVTTLIGSINIFFVKAGIHKPDILLESEFQFRMSILLDITMYALVMWMAVALYILTKSINKNKALLGFVFRAAEVVMGFVMVLLYTTPLIILSKAESYQFNNDTLHSLAEVFFDIYRMGSNLHLILMSIGAFIFIKLLKCASYIPKWLSYWGLFTYATVFVGFTLQILFPETSKQLMVVMVPGAFFELIFGIWLLTKGVRINKDF